MTRYDFREATYFLNECVPLDDLQNDVCVAMNMLDRRLSKEKGRDMGCAALMCRLPRNDHS